MNINRFNISYILVAIFLITSCASANFLANNFNETTKNHKLVAVIPVEMVFKGKQPKGLSEEDIKQIEEAESRAFQISLYNNLLSQSGPKKKEIKISFQSIDKTNHLLASNDISVRESWQMQPDELAKLLSVDSVVKTKISKLRYMSDLASFGVSIAESILNNIPGVYTYYGLSKTTNIDAECNLYDGKDGILLYNDVYSWATDYHRPANEIIEALTRKFSKTFPYRNK